MAKPTNKPIIFPTYNITHWKACLIVKSELDNPNIPPESKVLAIEKVARMETHNSITKDDLVHSLCWLFEHYDF